MKEQKIKVIIVDDEPLAREYIRRLLDGDSQIEIVGEAQNGKKALELIGKLKPDLIFLDVQMPGMDGFQMLAELGKDETPTIIFTTAYEEYAIRAFEFHAVDYLLKPFDKKRFTESLTTAKELIKSKTRQAQIQEILNGLSNQPKYLERILIKQKGKVIFLKVSDIDYIKADDKYVHLYFDQTSHMIRQSLTAMLDQLDPNRFVQIHRSTIINLESIAELHQTFNGQYNIILKKGTRLPLSRTYKNSLFELLGKPL